VVALLISFSDLLVNNPGHGSEHFENCRCNSPFNRDLLSLSTLFYASSNLTQDEPLHWSVSRFHPAVYCRTYLLTAFEAPPARPPRVVRVTYGHTIYGIVGNDNNFFIDINILMSIVSDDKSDSPKEIWAHKYQDVSGAVHINRSDIGTAQDPPAERDFQPNPFLSQGK
jgi:hypothetical protein